MSLRTYDRLPDGVTRLRRSSMAKDAWLVECVHAPAQRAERPTGIYSTPPSGRTFCSVCNGDEYTTSNYARPVKLIVVAPEGAPQEALF